jgi:hypothetical protein
VEYREYVDHPQQQLRGNGYLQQLLLTRRINTTITLRGEFPTTTTKTP